MTARANAPQIQAPIPQQNRAQEQTHQEQSHAVVEPSTRPLGANLQAITPKPEVAHTQSDSTINSSASRATATAHNEPQGVLEHLNSTRAGMTGINQKPLPTGDVAVHSDGSTTINSSGGRLYSIRANGTVASFSAKGQTASFNTKGQISSLHTASMDIHRNANGQRMIATKLSNNAVLVSTSNHSGYLQRTVVANNQTYVQRTFVANNQVVTRTFVTYTYGGVVLDHYLVPVYFAPAFYGWAYYPWTAPIAYTWGWSVAPWYVGPNPYFVAYQAYPSASLWLTDYFLGETLAIAAEREAALHDAALEEARWSDATNADAAQTAHADRTTQISPELKAEIASQIREQLAYDTETAQSSTGTPSPERGDLPSVLQTPNYVFVASEDLDVTTVDQEPCSLQAGDILQLTAPAKSGSPVVQLRVASSRRTDCPAGAQVTVSLEELQEMYNNFRSQVEAGLTTLHDNTGHQGLPTAPQAAVLAPPRPASTDVPAPSADDVKMLLRNQEEQADQAEAQVVGSAFDSRSR
jgi:hypothetical protein